MLRSPPNKQQGFCESAIADDKFPPAAVTHCVMRNLTDEFDLSLLSPERFVSLTLASDLSGIWGQDGCDRS